MAGLEFPLSLSGLPFDKQNAAVTSPSLGCLTVHSGLQSNFPIPFYLYSSLSRGFFAGTGGGGVGRTGRFDARAARYGGREEFWGGARRRARTRKEEEEQATLSHNHLTHSKGSWLLQHGLQKSLVSRPILYPLIQASACSRGLGACLS
jgi:hypothetical protein